MGYELNSHLYYYHWIAHWGVINVAMLKLTWASLLWLGALYHGGKMSKYLSPSSHPSLQSKTGCHCLFFLIPLWMWKEYIHLSSKQSGDGISWKHCLWQFSKTAVFLFVMSQIYNQVLQTVVLLGYIRPFFFFFFTIANIIKEDVCLYYLHSSLIITTCGRKLC